MSLLPECYHWSERALLALDEASRGSAEEMHLQAGLGISGMYMHAGREAAHEALNRSLQIAETRKDALDQLRILGPLHMFHLRTGEFKTALHYARRCSEVAVTIEDAATTALCHFFLGNALHFSGDLSGARAELAAAMDGGPSCRRTPASYLGFEGRNLAGGILARNLWLQGYPEQADFRARQTIKEAAETDHSVALCIALLGGIAVSLWSGDLQGADEHIELLTSRAGLDSLSPYVVVARGFQGEVAARRGDVKGGIAILRQCVENLHVATYEVFTTMLEISLIEALTAAGRYEESVSRLDGTIKLVETNGDLCYMPELLRIRGKLQLSMPPRLTEAEAYLTRFLELSRERGATSWELRTATDLAALRAGPGTIAGSPCVAAARV